MAAPSGIERLASRIGIGSGMRQIGRTTLVRLISYYAVVLTVIAGLILVTDNMSGMRAADPKGTEPALEHALFEPILRALPPLATGAAAVIAAFLLALPVAFTYVRTRASLKYDQSVVQTVIMLPVVVTSILIVVENSLALAFSLAGIVAAVRFRNNLKDSRDAVYIFAAVGVGFASGVGALAIAAFLSVFFCALELLLWKWNLTADHEHTFGVLCMPAHHGSSRPELPELPPPAADVTRDPSANAHLPAALLPPASPDAHAENGVEKKPADRLLVYVTDPDKARGITDAVLADMAKRHKLKKTRNGGNDQYVLEYRVWTRKKVPVAAILDRIQTQGLPYVIAAEVVPDVDPASA